MRLDKRPFGARRLSALPHIKRGESLSKIARQLGVSRQVVHQWAQQYRLERVTGPRPRRFSPGRPPKLDRRKLAQLPLLVARGAETYGFSTAMWTAQRVADLMWMRFQVRYCSSYVCRLLRRFGWSWQKPTGHARWRDEPTIESWVPQTRCRLKRKSKI
jgi:transposase